MGHNVWQERLTARTAQHGKHSHPRGIREEAGEGHLISMTVTGRAAIIYWNSMKNPKACAKHLTKLFLIFTTTLQCWYCSQLTAEEIKAWRDQVTCCRSERQRVEGLGSGSRSIWFPTLCSVHYRRCTLHNHLSGQGIQVLNEGAKVDELSDLLHSLGLKIKKMPLDIRLESICIWKSSSFCTWVISDKLG